MAAFDIADGIGNHISGTGKLMTAKTALNIAKAFAKRTLGWIGAAVAISDHTNCINGK